MIVAVTDGATIFGFDVEVIIAAVGVIAAVASAVAAIFAFCVARRSSRFQETVARNAILNLKYQNEIKHLQNLISNFSEIRALAFDYNNKNRKVELDLLGPVDIHRKDTVV